MKLFGICVVLLGFTLYGCSQKAKSKESIETKDIQVKAKTIKKAVADKVVIQTLIRDVLKWGSSKMIDDLTPAIKGKGDSLYIAFDMIQVNENVEKLRQSHLFSEGFIKNYEQIIKELDRKLKTNTFEYGPWYVGDMPPFNFASYSNPWCQCQDHLSWDLVEVKHMRDHDYIWKWLVTEPEQHSSWKDFTYEFTVINENGKWKISYLKGFDINRID